MLILGIETSCDETAAAVVENGRNILSNVVSSSLRLHRPYGGVVPEIAARRHAELIDRVTRQALNEAKTDLKKIKCIAVTSEPGLIGALLIGGTFARGLSIAGEIPLLSVNHIHAHLYAPLMRNGRVGFPYVGLAVSGGHTSLLLAEDYDKYRLLGQTTDDAAGEAFDKVAKVLGLGYPGGPIIEKLAKKGNPRAIKFPVSRLGEGSLDFSFSGIKTAVLYYVQRTRRGTMDEGRWTRDEKRFFVHRPSDPETSGERSSIVHRLKADIPDICASFQQSVIDVLVEKSIRACVKKKVKRLVVGGGVSINSRLRAEFESRCGEFNIKVYYPAKKLCLDNAAMVAGLGYRLFKRRR